MKYRLSGLVYVLSVILFLAISIFMILVPHLFVRVAAGNVGVLYHLFSGTELNRTLPEGLHVKFPMDDIIPYDVRIQKAQQELNILSNSGLSVHLELTYWFRIDPARAAYIHSKIGPDYAANIVSPALVSAAREVIGSHSPEELYTSMSAKMQTEIVSNARGKLGPYGVIAESVLVTFLTLPDMVNQAIESKLEMQQQSLAYEFRIRSAQQEKERKRIEGEGIRDMNRLIASTLSPHVLNFMNVQGMRDLATAPNSKVVVLGGGQQGGVSFPLFLSDYLTEEAKKSAPTPSPTPDALDETPSPETAPPPAPNQKDSKKAAPSTPAKGTPEKKAASPATPPPAPKGTPPAEKKASSATPAPAPRETPPAEKKTSAEAKPSDPAASSATSSSAPPEPGSDTTSTNVAGEGGAAGAGSSSRGAAGSKETGLEKTRGDAAQPPSSKHTGGNPSQSRRGASRANPALHKAGGPEQC